MDDKLPLHDEAERRAEWRGEKEPLRPEAGGHTLPASEESDFDKGGDHGGGTSLPASEDDDERLLGDIQEEPVSHPGIIPPPD